MAGRTLAVVLSLAALTGCGADGAPPEGRVAAPAAPVVDSHLHLRTAAAAELFASTGVDEALVAVRAADAIAALDAAGITHGLVLSVAYQFGDPDLEHEDEAALVRAENDYVAREAALVPERLTAACSVNPLAAYAVVEVERCMDELGVRILKLHLTNSNVDLRSSEDVERLRDVFRLLDRRGGAAVVHLRTRREDYGAPDARRFIDAVLSVAPSVRVHVAHMAGWGGYDNATDDALGEFATALGEGRLDGDRIWFGLGAVVFLPEAAGPDTALASRVREANAQLAARIREIGLDRVVYGTDWPGWPPVPEPSARIAANVDLVRAASGLHEDELAQVFSNRGLLEPSSVRN